MKRMMMLKKKRVKRSIGHNPTAVNMDEADDYIIIDDVDDRTTPLMMMQQPYEEIQEYTTNANGNAIPNTKTCINTNANENAVTTDYQEARSPSLIPAAAIGMSNINRDGQEESTPFSGSSDSRCCNDSFCQYCCCCCCCDDCFRCYSRCVGCNCGFGCGCTCEQWLRDAVWPGMGLFGESYLLFSIGTMRPIWETLFPRCFGTVNIDDDMNAADAEYADDVYDGLGAYYSTVQKSECTPLLLHSLSYSVVLGVITGMLLIGYAASFIGRRYGSLLTSFLMTVGACGLTASSMYLADLTQGVNRDRLLIAMVTSLFVFGLGVGGEYPLAASSASETAMSNSLPKDQLHVPPPQHDAECAAVSQKCDRRQFLSPPTHRRRGSRTCDEYGAVVRNTPSLLDSIQEEEEGSLGNQRNNHVVTSSTLPTVVLQSTHPVPSVPPASTTPVHQPGTKALPKQRRGRQVQLVFAMQGMGILFNAITMTSLLFLTKQTGGNDAKAAGDDANDDAAIVDDEYNNAAEYDNEALLMIWRITYGIGAVILIFVFFSRCIYLEESQVWQENKKQRDDLVKINEERRTMLAEKAIKIFPARNGNVPIPSQQRHNQILLHNNNHTYYGQLRPPLVPERSTIQQQLPTVPSATATNTVSSSASTDCDTSGVNSYTESITTSITTTQDVSVPSAIGFFIPTSLPGRPIPTTGRVLPSQQGRSQRGSSVQLFVTVLPQPSPDTALPNRINHNNYVPQNDSYSSYSLNAASVLLPSAPTVVSAVSSLSALSAPSAAESDDVDTAQQQHEDEEEDEQKDNVTISELTVPVEVDNELPPPIESYLLLKNFGVRLLGVSLSWLLWDVSFYGNKLFQSSFLLTLTGEETTLLQFSLAATLNSAVALLGYFGAAAIVDHPAVGRWRLQQLGFLLTGSLFVACGYLFDDLSPAVLVSMYLGTSFFGQLGPNATTFLIPAEIFPTEMRTVCHGIAAASGKIGALIAAIMFNHVGNIDMFMVSGYASFAACIITFWTIPESSGLDLFELDRKWQMILDGRHREYDGPANSPQYLSLYESLRSSR